MSIALLKQQEINQYLAEADAMLKDVREIEQLCEQYSDRFKVFSTPLYKIGGNTIKNANNLRDGLIGLGALALGGVVDYLAESSAEKKRKEALKKLLPKKQAIAKAKLSYIEKQLPKMKDYALLFKKQCEEEAQICHKNKTDGEMVELEKNMVQIFDLYQKFTFLHRICVFFKSEFSAWKKGELESKNSIVNFHTVYIECVQNLINWSDVPYHINRESKDITFYGSYINPSIGSIVLFKDNTINLYANADRYFNTYTLAITNKYYSLKKSEKRFYDKYIRKNVFVQDASRINIKRSIALLLIITFCTAIGSYIYFSSVFLGIISALFSIIAVPILGGIFILYQLNAVQQKRIKRIYQQTGFLINEDINVDEIDEEEDFDYLFEQQISVKERILNKINQYLNYPYYKSSNIESI